MLNNGWQCPGCNKCYAPWVSECGSCGKTEVTWNPYVNITQCQHLWGEPTTGGTFCTVCGTIKVEWEKPGNTCGGSNG